MILEEWAKIWGVSTAALENLRNLLGCGFEPPKISGKSEAYVQNIVRLEASKKNIVLWRNNVGAYKDEYGNYIRYGLCNDSKGINDRYKSSDLIGIKKVIIQPSMIGNVIGQFVARETKKEDWKYVGNKHEEAQLRFIQLVTSFGGDACFANREGTL